MNWRDLTLHYPPPLTIELENHMKQCYKFCFNTLENSREGKSIILAHNFTFCSSLSLPDSFFYHFVFYFENFLSHSFRVVLLVMIILVWFHLRVFWSPPFFPLKDIFTEYEILSWQLFSFRPLPSGLHSYSWIVCFPLRCSNWVTSIGRSSSSLLLSFVTSHFAVEPCIIPRATISN